VKDERHGSTRGSLDRSRQSFARDLAHASADEPELELGEFDGVAADRGRTRAHGLVDPG
jgi:hypothetical protein